MEDMVSATIAQKAYADSGYELANAASLCGYKSTTDFKRAIGLEEYNSHGEKHLVREMDYRKAGRIVQALNLWPVDYGL
jgi:hypothetical protein